MIRSVSRWLPVALGLAACGTAADLRGSGPLTLSPEVEAVYQAYLQRTRNTFQPGYFAVSPDGRDFGAAYCADHRCRGNAKAHALRLCNEKRSEPDCRLYARGDTLVWRAG